jgi:hypothetical protein
MLKRTILAGMFFLFLGAVGAYAQFPAEGINYQAVARNAQGNVISTPITVRISVLSGSPTGTLQYQETHNTTPNSLGLFNLSIGQGIFSGGAVNNFASINWGGASHYAKTEINTGSGFTDMGTTQLWAVPYALYAKNAGSGGGSSYTAGSGISIAGGVISAVDNSATNEIQTLAISGSTLSISGGNNITLPSGSGGGTLDQAYDFGGPGAGKIITADSGPVTINGTGAGAGNIGLLLTHNGSGTSAMGINFSGTGTGIQAISTNAANTFATIQASSNSSTVSNSAILGQSTGAARAVTGQVEATATADAAVRGLNSRTSGGIGVEGVGFNGVSGQTTYREGYGVFGLNLDQTGPLTANSAGVAGIGYIGVIGQSNDPANGAGLGSLDNLIAVGTKNFRIDHPLDPANKYLNHFSIESDEVLNIYRGTIMCDAQGMATVTLPNYVSAVNTDFSYQLTPIGAYAGLFIGKKMENGTFVIAGALPGMEVSWQLTGKRNDAYLQKYPNAAKVETDKAEGDKGRYLRPELYNQSADKGIFRQLQK